MFDQGKPAGIPKLSVSIQQISPLPTVSELSTKRRKPRKKGKMGVINSTPDIEEEKSVENVKRQKEREKLARAANRKLEATDEPDVECTQINHEQDDDAEDVACLYCNEFYSWSKSKELWLKCQLCSLWAHAACADKSLSMRNGGEPSLWST
ncbi:unnamed protein product [Phaedon cochleariae]|uniref:Zinc finger PHD-type domain-containing protein n=1 Tax=Phaedon cochleariae TaxID=80249 RepID=A0A9N9SC67_PHACE|nr:unnamed protein product [Phaedon cochleariae]